MKSYVIFINLLITAFECGVVMGVFCVAFIMSIAAYVVVLMGAARLILYATSLFRRRPADRMGRR